MTLFGNLATFIGVCALFSYTALQILLLVRSIQAIIGKDGLCTDSSFRWVWFICVTSAMCVFRKPDKDSIKKPSEAGCLVVILLLMSLGFAVGTQLQYLDGCPDGTSAHLVMYIYMWGNYAVAATITLVTLLCVLDARLEENKKKKAQADMLQAGTP